jgi:hypothetical protein
MTALQSEAVAARQKRWHQSTLANLLDGCSWQYFLTYVLEMDTGVKPYATVGTAYHSAVELHEINRMNDEKTSLDEMISLAKQNIQDVVDDDTLRAELDDMVVAALQNWYKGHRPWLLENTIPLAIEPEFTLPLVEESKPIGGYIDAVYMDKTTGAIFIVDHKTAKDYNRWRDASKHRYQAAMYAAALVLSDDFPQVTELPEMVYMVSRTSTSTRADFEPTRVVRVQPDMEDIKLLGERIRAAETIVVEELYKPKTDWPLCSAKWCPFFQGCQVTGELSGTVELVTSRVRQQSEAALLESSPTTTEEVTND